MSKQSRFLVFSVVALCTLLSVVSVYSQVDVVGSLDKELRTNRSSLSQTSLSPMNIEEAAKHGVVLVGGEKAFKGRVRTGQSDRTGLSTLVVEGKDAPAVFYIDTDNDGKFSARERRVSGISAEPEYFQSELVISIAVKSTFYKTRPLLLILFKSDKDPFVAKGKRALLFAYESYSTGKAKVGDSEVRVQYTYDPEKDRVLVKDERLGVDTDGDGEVNMDSLSPESTYAKDEIVVFRAGRQYVSTTDVNVAAGTFTLRKHPPTDYIRIELELGTVLEDFNFVDFQGRQHKLSDYRGKYVLMDFWGSWCGQCHSEMPFLTEAYKKYNRLGFEIVGMDKDSDPQKARNFIADYKMTWVSATTESIENLLSKRFRISGFPEAILIDPKGKIISLGRSGQLRLRGKGLGETMDSLLIKKE